MSLFMENGLYFPEEDPDDRGIENEVPGLDYLEDASRSVELVREEGRDGQLASFGFTLVQDKPPRVGTVIPGGPADRAGLRKGEIVLNVAGKDVTRLSHKEVTLLIRSNTDTAIWLSVCEADEAPGLQSTSFMSSSPQKSFYSSTPILVSQHEDRRFSGPGLHHKALNNSTLLSSIGGRDGYQYSSSPRNGPSPLVHKKAMTQNDPAYVEFVPPPPPNSSSSGYIMTRMWCMLLYCGPVKIPSTWSQRGVSSLCIQECARQLLGKRKSDEFVKVHLEVSQSYMKITNTSGNIFAKHKRDGLYYCGLCSNDEQHFGIVTLDPETNSWAEMCHVFKLLPDSKLSKYCIDRSKSLREVRSGQPTPLKTCVEITETIQTIFQNEVIPAITHRKSIDGLSDSIEYGVVRGVNMFQLAPGSNDSISSPMVTTSPMLKRKKSSVVDLRVNKRDQKILPIIPGAHGKQRSISIPINPHEQRSLAHTSSAGHVHEPIHVRMGSDGSVTSSTHSPSSLPRNRTLPTMLLRTHAPSDKAKRISDSSLSSVSSDGHRSHSGSSSPKHGSGSPTPHESLPLRPLPRKHSHQHPHALPSSARPGITGRVSVGSSGGSGLKRQGSANSLSDLPGLSPYHHFGLPKKNSLLSSSVDSIVTITTLAEDDIETIVGQVAGWCGSFDKLLEDPLGLKCFEQFLEREHSEENIRFWKDVQLFKVTPESNVSEASRRIYEEYLSPTAPQAINIDDRVQKVIEPLLESPTRHMYNEAQKEIYRLMRMDSYTRFKKSEIVKECLFAEMEGRPLPVSLDGKSSPSARKEVGGVNGVVGSSGKKKNFLSRIKSIPSRSTTTPLLSPSTPTGPSVEHPLLRSAESKRSKKERKDSKKLRTKSVEGSSSHPEENLKQLQIHKSNIFELSLPTRVTKIIEARPNTTIGEAISNVLKKYKYSLELMEVKMTNTLQPVDISAQATTLIGKHVSVIRSKHTITVKFPDGTPDTVLPANSSYSLRDLFDNMMVEKENTHSYSVYLEGARAPMELNMSAGKLEGHTVHLKYNPSNTFPSNTASTPPKKTAFNDGLPSTASTSSAKLSEGVDELFSMIARLSADTLQDQSIIEDMSPQRTSLPKEPKKGKWLAPRTSPKFSRTKSGTAIPEKRSGLTQSIPPRSVSPPVSMMNSLPVPHYPPPPKSDPPNASLYGDSYTYTSPPRHIHQRSADAMSGISVGSGSSVDSITHELSADRRAFAHNNLREWVNNSATNPPQYFPTALGSQDTLDRTDGRTLVGGRTSLPNSRGSSLTRGHAPLAKSYSARPLHQTEMSSAFQRQNGGNLQSSSRLGPGSVVGSDRMFSDAESMASSSCHSNTSGKRVPLSPTTHVLVVEDQQHSETFV